MSSSQKTDINSILRQRMLNQRKALGAEKASELSQLICSRLSQSGSELGLFIPGFRVGLYRSFQLEVDLSSLEVELRALGCRIYFPRMASGLQKSQGQMEFVEMREGDPSQSLWVRSPLGFDEPHASLPAVPSSELEAVFIPGVAFGESGERIGRGAGFYDRYLSQNSSALRIGVAYDFQVLPQIEGNSWDQGMHWIVTETREVKTLFFEAWKKERASK